MLYLEPLAVSRVLLQHPVPKALQDPAKEPCVCQQWCRNIENGEVSHPGLVEMLSLSGDQEEQQHWRALIYHLLLLAERCKPYSFVNLIPFFLSLLWLQYLVRWQARYEGYPAPLKRCAVWIVWKVVTDTCIDSDWALHKAETWILILCCDVNFLKVTLPPGKFTPCFSAPVPIRH